MDQTNGRHIVSKEELQGRMHDTRNSMAETMGEIKHELTEAFEWRTYLRRYPGTCLMAGGAIGWMLGRSLGTLQQSPHSFRTPELPSQPSESSKFPRMADKVVSTVLAEALPIIAAKIRRFSNLANPTKE
jgi:hypothetical protein